MKRNNSIYFKGITLFFAILIALTFMGVNTYAGASNLLRNSSFEDSSSLEDSKWTQFSQGGTDGAAEFAIDENQKHSRSRSLRITNNKPGYSGLSQKLNLKKNSYYKISAWVKTENIPLDGAGAGFNIKGLDIAPVGGNFTKPLSNNGEAALRYITINPVKEGPLNINSLEFTGTNKVWQNIYWYIKTGNKSGEVTISVQLGNGKGLAAGSAWFDDIVVEESNPGFINSTGIVLQVFSIILLVLITFVAFTAVKKKSKKIKGAGNQKGLSTGNAKYALYSMFGLAFVLKILIGAYVEGHNLDIYCFKTWSSVAAETFRGVYNSGVFLDYPPLYIYILAVIGKLAEISGLYTIPWLYVIVLKIPSIAAEIATGILIYKISGGHFSNKMRLFLTGIYLFNPTMIIDTSMWGQIDSLFTLIIVAALLLLQRNKYCLSSILFAIAVLTKPQGLIFLPIIFFAVVKSRSIKYFFYSLICGLATIFVIALPFSFTQEPLWVFKLYTNSVSGYTVAAQGAYNLFSLLGADGKEDSTSMLFFSYYVWGYIFIVAVSIFVWYLYIKCQEKYIPLLGAFVLMTGVFMLSSRMHERYLFPVLVLGLITFIYVRDRRILLLYGCFSATLYNSILVQYLKIAQIPIQLASFINLLLFIYMIKIFIDIVVKKRIDVFGYNKA